MSTFSDDFNRGDGGVGNGWIVTSGAFAIVSGHVQNTGTSRMHQQAVSASGRQEIIATVTLGVAADMGQGPLLKADSVAGEDYYAYASGTLASPSWLIRKRAGASNSTIGTFGGSGLSAGDHTIRFLYESGILYLWVDGAYIGSAADATYADNTEMGWYGPSTQLASLNAINLYGDVTTSFSVDPSPIGNYGNTTEVTFTGVGTSWSAGTPGTPTFTVSNGSLSSQVVANSGSATATYDPGEFLGIATFTDPSTGATCNVTVTSNPTTVPISEICPFDQDFIDTANATTVADTLGFPTLETVIVPPGEGLDAVNLLNAIADVWIAHFRPEFIDNPPTGGIDRIGQLWLGLNGTLVFDGTTYIPDHAGSVKEDTDKLLTAIETLTTTYTDLADVVGILGGEPTVYSHADLKTAIDNISGGSNQDVLDALAAYFGENPPTIEQLGTMVSDIATIAGYDLGDVLTAIAAIPTNTITSLQPVLDRLDDIQPSGTDTLTTIQAAIVPSSAIQSIVDAGTLAIAGEEGATIAAVLDAIAALQPASGGGAPVWPGLDGVTFGTPEALTGQLHLEGAMDGVIVAVTTPPTHTGLRVIGGANYDYNVGEVAFETDNGDIEPWQYMGFRAAIFTPKTMAHAAGARFRILAGAEGTVTPWTVS